MTDELAWIEEQWRQMEVRNPTQTLLDASGSLLECPQITQRPMGEQGCLPLFDEAPG